MGFCMGCYQFLPPLSPRRGKAACKPHDVSRPNVAPAEVGNDCTGMGFDNRRGADDIPDYGGEPPALHRPFSFNRIPPGKGSLLPPGGQTPITSGPLQRRHSSHGYAHKLM